eukprot:1635852-Pleurochrysis_carterae.AAC.6
MDGLESRVIVDEHQKVLVSRVVRTHEWARDVGVDDASGERWLILCMIMRVPCRVGFRTGRATVEAAMSEGCWGVRSSRWQRPKARASGMRESPGNGSGG